MRKQRGSGAHTGSANLASEHVNPQFTFSVYQQDGASRCRGGLVAEYLSYIGATPVYALTRLR